MLGIDSGSGYIFEPTPDPHDLADYAYNITHEVTVHDTLGTSEGTISLQESRSGNKKLYARSGAPSKKELKVATGKQHRKQNNHRRANDPDAARNRPENQSGTPRLAGFATTPKPAGYVPPRLKSTSPFAPLTNAALWER